MFRFFCAEFKILITFEYKNEQHNICYNYRYGSFRNVLRLIFWPNLGEASVLVIVSQSNFRVRFLLIESQSLRQEPHNEMFDFCLIRILLEFQNCYCCILPWRSDRVAGFSWGRGATTPGRGARPWERRDGMTPCPRDRRLSSWPFRDCCRRRGRCLPTRTLLPCLSWNGEQFLNEHNVSSGRGRGRGGALLAADKTGGDGGARGKRGSGGPRRRRLTSCRGRHGDRRSAAPHSPDICYVRFSLPFACCQREKTAHVKYGDGRDEALFAPVTNYVNKIAQL